VSGARHAWIDASAGVAGDMLLGALLDAGADPDAVQHAVDAVAPGAVRVVTTPVVRAGLRAVKADVRTLQPGPARRTWRDVRTLLEDGALSDTVRTAALAVFARLATAEAHVHGIDAQDVHFHEVGALDAIADVVGVCAALDDLGVGTVSCSAVAVGSGRARTAHGDLPVPVPAVAELARGWRVRAGGTGELATPTGMAVVRALCVTCEDLPAMIVDVVGVGAGTRDTPGRANVVRAVLGTPVGHASASASAPASASASASASGPAVLLEANVDDVDPRLWPGVLSALLGAGAADAWLVPIVMKKGRPAHTLTVLCAPEDADALRAEIFRHTTTFGVRESRRHKVALARDFVAVSVDGGTVVVKIAYHNGVIEQVMPEFDDVAALARRLGRPERVVMQEAMSAAAAAGLTVGARARPRAPA